MDRKCSLIQSLILEIIAVSGEVLKSDLMNISEFKNKYIKQTICDLKKDNLIKESTIDNMKTLRLASKGKMFLTQLYHERYNDLFSGGRQSNKVRSSPQRRKRALNLAQVIILLRQTDVKIFRDEKLLLYDDYCPCADCVDSEFYTSMELKELFVEFNKSRGSRALGILITKSYVYLVYNTGKNPMKWQGNTELKFRVTVEKEIIRKIFKNTKEIRWLLIGTEEDMPQTLYKTYNTGKEKCISIDFDNVEKCFVKFQCEAISAVKLISDEELYKRTAEYICEQYGLRKNDKTKYEYIDEDNSPVFFAFDYKLKEINDFILRTARNSQGGNIVCFEHQVPYLSMYYGNEIGVYKIRDDILEEVMQE